jgi:pilus assembly protein CpaB
MSRGRVFLYLSLILILLLVGGYVAYQNFFKPTETAQPVSQPTPVPDTVDIVVVTQKAARGTVLNETLLGKIALPRDVVIPGMFTDLAQVVGRQAKFDLDSGIPLTANMLVDSADQLSETGSVASLSIPEGMVAKSIPINRFSSVAYALQPGDRVVVIASMQFIDLDREFQTELPNRAGLVFQTGITQIEEGEQGASGETLTLMITGSKDSTTIGKATETGDFFGETIYALPSEDQRPRLASQIIIPSATVLQVGEFAYDEKEEKEEPLPTPTPSPESQQPAPTPEPESKPPDIITLIVTPQEAVNLTYLLNSGVDLHLALRSAGDSTVVDTQTVTINYLLDAYTIPLPEKLPYGFEARVDDVMEEVEKEAKATPVP